LKKIISLFLIFSFGCRQNIENTKDSVFILPHPTPTKNKDPKEPPPPPPPIEYPYYFDHNFLIDTGGVIFYFAREHHRFFSGTGIDINTPPDFINLKPSDLVQLPNDLIGSFISENLLNQDRSRRLSTISIVRDSIWSPGLFKIVEIFKQNHVPWLYRKTTQEESAVIKFKKMQTYYDCESVKWDSSKIRFPLNIGEKTKFTIPTVENK
jgi:hypothetical protein